MDDTSRILINVLVPGLLSIGGIVFLLLAFTRRVGQLEAVPKDRQRLIVVGILLLVSGAGLYTIATGLDFLLALQRTDAVAVSLPSPSPNPAATVTHTLSLTESEGTLQAEAALVSGEIVQTAAAVQMQTAVVLTADALISLPVTPDARATASVRLTQTQQALAAQVTGMAGPTLTQMAVDTTSVAALWTATASPTQTVTGLPTATSLATSAALSSGVEVLFRDGFEGQRLSIQWQSNGIAPTVREDRLVFTGVNRWGDLVARTGIEANEGVLLLFRFSGGQMEIFLESGKFGEPDYRRWGFMRHGSGWEIASTREAEYTAYKSVTLQSWVWYYLLLRVDENGRFITQVWERDNPVTYIVNLAQAPEGEEWDNRFWRFVTQVHNGTLEVDFYEELRFPKGYQNPEIPPQGEADKAA